MPDTTCLIDGCSREAYSRGVCRPCFQSSRDIIRRKWATDAQLVRSGLLLPPKRPAPRRMTPFRKAFEETKEANNANAQ